MCLTQAGSDALTAQGHEIQLGTNVLGHQHLIQLLRPALVEAAANSPKESVRVIITSTSAHFYFTKALAKDWELTDEAAKKHKPEALYGRSKLGNIHQARRFADELEPHGVVVASLHPGNIQSELREWIQ